MTLAQHVEFDKSLLTFDYLSFGDNMASLNPFYRRKEGNVLFNDALNTFYLRLYGVGHMVKDHSDSEISSRGFFICTIPHTG